MPVAMRAAEGAPSGPATAYTLDLSRRPLVIARPTSSIDDPAAITAFFAAIQAFLAGGERFVSLIDLRGVRSNPARRKRFIDFVEPKRALVRRLCVAHGAIVRTPVERGFMTAYLWLFGGKDWVPIKVFTSENEGTEWLLAQYEAAGRG